MVAWRRLVPLPGCGPGTPCTQRSRPGCLHTALLASTSSHLGQAHSRCRWSPGFLAHADTPSPNPPFQITSSSPSHPANSFYYPRLKALPPIARVTLVRLRQSPRAYVPPAIDLTGRSNEIVDSLSGKPRSPCQVPHPQQFLG